MSRSDAKSPYQYGVLPADSAFRYRQVGIGAFCLEIVFGGTRGGGILKPVALEGEVDAVVVVVIGGDHLADVGIAGEQVALLVWVFFVFGKDDELLVAFARLSFEDDSCPVAFVFTFVDGVYLLQGYRVGCFVVVDGDIGFEVGRQCEVGVERPVWRAVGVVAQEDEGMEGVGRVFESFGGNLIVADGEDEVLKLTAAEIVFPRADGPRVAVFEDQALHIIASAEGVVVDDEVVVAAVDDDLFQSGAALEGVGGYLADIGDQDFCQCLAAFKEALVDEGDALGDGDVGQGCAVHEEAVGQRYQLAGFFKGYAFEFHASQEGVVADGGDGVGNGNLPGLYAEEGADVDGLQGVWQGDVVDGSGGEGMWTDGGDVVGQCASVSCADEYHFSFVVFQHDIAAGRRIEGGVALFHGNLVEVRAGVECAAAEGCAVLRHAERTELLAVVEDAVADALYGGGEGEVFQFGTVVEGASDDFFQAFGGCELAELLHLHEASVEFLYGFGDRHFLQFLDKGELGCDGDQRVAVDLFRQAHGDNVVVVRTSIDLTFQCARFLFFADDAEVARYGLCLAGGSETFEVRGECVVVGSLHGGRYHSDCHHGNNHLEHTPCPIPFHSIVN